MKKIFHLILSLLLFMTTCSSTLFAAPLIPFKTTTPNDSRITYKLYKGTTPLTNLSSFPKVSFDEAYSPFPGIYTFRGGPFRDRAAYGTAKVSLQQLEKKWSFTTHSSSWGGGAGWTGQPAIVKWPELLKDQMNLYDSCKSDPNFVEVIYASLSGYIYFLDLHTGKPSRPSIHIGNPIKGSVSIDPRGYPLLYVGEGIPEKGTIGYNIFSLIDGKRLYYMNGIDSTASRGWGAFDSSSLVDAKTDTLIVGGENGLLYLIKLGSHFDSLKGTISLNPVVYKLKYNVKGTSKYGIENSVAIYNNLVYFADNSGRILCVNLHTMNPVWVFNAGDDTDATLVLDHEGTVPYLYTGNEVDHQGTSGTCTLRKINGLTGKVVWEKPFPCQSIIGEKAVNGGLLATPVLGKNNLEGLVIFSVARYNGMQPGLMVAFDKHTGTQKWSKNMAHYMWSSPVACYTSKGQGYIIQCDSIGNMFLLDGLTGKELHKINLGSNIEASPTIFENTIVVAPRGNKIIGVTIK